MEIKEVVTLSINGEKQDDLIPDLIRIEVEEDVDAASVFRVEIALNVERDGSWRYIDEKELFRVWNRVSIEAGYPESGVETLIDGCIGETVAAAVGFAGSGAAAAMGAAAISAVQDW